ncbi:LytR/AlgR family response regulator transcription factor [Eubacterium aggregans]|uniref:LytR/AlgR family response regulator transcription factor n=1 Tax=Eubacterium aggregans TaxID=81409 RepID=UPI003F383671
MKILVIDDEKIALKGTIEVVATVVPEVEITGVRSAEAALKLMEDSINNQIVFMDIEMRDMNGITLAKRLKVLHPTLNIIFTTGYSEYAGDAFSLHASGYIMKPITPQKVEMELLDLRHPIPVETNCLRVVACGNFEAYCGEVPLSFKYSKTKELLAFLIDKRGLCVPTERFVRHYERMMVLKIRKESPICKICAVICGRC